MAETENKKKKAETAGGTDPEENTNKKNTAKADTEAASAEFEELKTQLAAAEEKLAAENDKYLRLAAEYDNFRKRTVKEREGIYADAYVDAIKQILPIIDNFERAATYSDSDSLADGVKLILKGIPEALGKMSVTEIECKIFDPNLHNAVMHIEDDAYGEGEVVEVLQKGYMRGDKVIRYAMVKVAN